ncbi:MAG: hypothetical protein E7565_10135 [Ruminococcaceae bacterium]|jgi:hypothetical protein|nr:hypothetical protein [Oscillospiraceae bacterium]
MKKRLLILAITVSITIITVIFSFIKVSAGYSSPMILKEKNGTVVLYKGKNIIKTYDEIVISVLPKRDQEALNSGIIIRNQEQLNAIIEDYDG